MGMKSNVPKDHKICKYINHRPHNLGEEEVYGTVKEDAQLEYDLIAISCRNLKKLDD